MNDLVAGHVPSLIASTPTAQRARGANGVRPAGHGNPGRHAGQVAARIAHETEVWKKVIADAGIRLD
jgi:hypothetical protein